MMSRGLEMVIKRDEEALGTPGGAGTNARVEKLVRWLMFSVLVSLVPLALTYFNLWLDHREGHLEALVARGELLLICTTWEPRRSGSCSRGTAIMDWPSC